MRLRTLAPAMFLTALAIPVMAQVGFSPSALTDTPYPLMLSALFIVLGLYGLNWHRRHERVIPIPQKEEPPASPWANELFSTLHAPEIATSLVPLPNEPTAYQRILKWVTNVSGSIRVFTYVPTILTLLAAADSRSYSLVTWCAWVVANASMTLSIYEASGRKVDHLVLVNICNTLMCLTTTLVIFYLR